MHFPYVNCRCSSFYKIRQNIENIFVLLDLIVDSNVIKYDLLSNIENYSSAGINNLKHNYNASNTKNKTHVATREDRVDVLVTKNHCKRHSNKQ